MPLIFFFEWFTVDIVKYLDEALIQKNFKKLFFKDIESSFPIRIPNKGTQIGSEPHHFFLFEIAQQIPIIWSLETSKVFVEMGRSWKAD